jgi:hypothetical protein
MKINTVTLGGKVRLISDDYIAANDIDPAKVFTYEFDHDDCTAGNEIEAGRVVAQSGLIVNGSADPRAVALSKGMSLAQQLIKGWDLKDANGQVLPLNAANVANLPADVLIEFGNRNLRGVPTEGEWESLKKPLRTNGSNTETGAGDAPTDAAAPSDSGTTQPVTDGSTS